MKKKEFKKSNFNINVVGLGFVGLVTAAVFAKKGFYINAVENNLIKLKNIKNNIIDFYEPNLEKNIKLYRKKLNFCSKIEIKKNKFNLIFLCVGTPSKKNGDINLSYINSFCQTLKKNREDQILLIIKSTVLPGTLDKIISKYFKNNKNILFCSNPEFLQEGSAFNDFIKSEKIVVGTDNNFVRRILEYIYKSFKSKFVFTNFVTAEFTKYLSNNLLASIISYSNFMKILSYKIDNIDLKKSFDSVKIDKRWFGNPANISKYFHPGIGFGGSCLPKDLSALKFLASQHLGENNILKNYLSINSDITEKVIKECKLKFNNSDKKNIIFLGASFKPGSDDTRYSKALEFIKKFLKKEKVNYEIYDELVKKVYISKQNNIVKNLKPKFNKKNFYILLTEWKTYINFLKKIPSKNYFDARDII